MKVSEAKEITGGLCKPSKMPGSAYSIPASACITGSKLAQIPGTVCHKCYAMKGRYTFPNVQNALHRRLEAIEDIRWVDAMIVLIKSSKDKYFRWHDSGDIQSEEHLKKIADVCKALPDVKFWLPTREYVIVESFKKSYTIPDNLVIRLSAHKVSAQPPVGYGLPTSTVHIKGEKFTGTECRAYTRDNQCGNCRACWDSKTVNVSYPKH